MLRSLLHTAIAYHEAEFGFYNAPRCLTRNSLPEYYAFMAGNIYAAFVHPSGKKDSSALVQPVQSNSHDVFRDGQVRVRVQLEIILLRGCKRDAVMTEDICSC